MFRIGALLGGTALWGVAWWPIKMLNQAGMDGAMLTLVAYGAAATAFVPTVIPHAVRLPARWRLLVLIFVSGGAWNLLFTYAMINGAASRAVLLYYLSTLWMIVGARVVLRESLGSARMICASLALLGASLVLGPRTLTSGHLSVPDLYAIGAGVAHAVTCLAFRHAEDIPVSSKNAFMFLGSVIGAGLLLAFFSAPPAATCVSTNAFLLAFAFGLCWVMVADSLVQFGVSHIPAGRAAILMLCELPITVLSAALIAREQLTPLELLGGALIMAASFVECVRGDAAASQSAPGSTRTTSSGDQVTPMSREVRGESQAVGCSGGQ